MVRLNLSALLDVQIQSKSHMRFALNLPNVYRLKKIITEPVSKVFLRPEYFFDLIGFI